MGFHIRHKCDIILCVKILPASLLCMASLLLVACDDAEEDEQLQVPVIDLSAVTRPAPRPERESLSISPRESSPVALVSGPRYEVFSRYEGQDITQVTGVSGRTLWLCFTAPWCPHSNRMIRELRTMAHEEKSGVQVVQVNADDYPELAEDFGITKVPTTILYTEGVKLRTIEGAYNAPSLRRYLHRVLSRDDDPGSDLTIPTDTP